MRFEKCSFGKPQIKYLGHLLDRHGVRNDPGKIDSIKLMPAPKDVLEVRSFLGAINFYGKFVPNMRALRYPLHELWSQIQLVAGLSEILRQIQGNFVIELVADTLKPSVGNHSVG